MVGVQLYVFGLGLLEITSGRVLELCCLYTAFCC